MDGAASRPHVLQHPAPDAVLVMWHGRGPNESHVLSRLASALHEDGHTVLTPNWDSTATDRGATVLRASLDQAAAIAAEHAVPLVLVGWSLGGTAALSLALHHSAWHDVAAVVGLAAEPKERSPLNGVRPVDGLRPGLGATPLFLVHGVRDTVVPAVHAEEFARACLAAGVPCSLSLIESDHAGVVGAEYDPAAEVCVPSDGPAATRGLNGAVRAVHAAVTR